MLILDANGASVDTLTFPQHLATYVVGPPVAGPIARGGGPGLVFPVTHGKLLALDAAHWDELPGFPKPGPRGTRRRWPSSMATVGPSWWRARATRRSTSTTPGPTPGGPSRAIWPTPRANFARTGSRTYAPPMPEEQPISRDLVPPERVTDLSSSAGPNAIVGLRWTVPADSGSGLDHYELRRAAHPIDDANFNIADIVATVPPPGETGAVDSVELEVDEETHFFFALRAVDRAANTSPVSNSTEVTSTAGYPARVNDLRFESAADSIVTLQFGATGDDGLRGRATSYDLRAASVPLDDSAYAAAPFPASRDRPTSIPAGPRP